MRLSTREHGCQDGYHFQERAFQQWIERRHYGALLPSLGWSSDLYPTKPKPGQSDDFVGMGTGVLITMEAQVARVVADAVLDETPSATFLTHMARKFPAAAVARSQ